MQAKFLKEQKPRLLSLNDFSWNDNILSGKFQGCGNNQGFLKVWMEFIRPFLNQNGVFTSDHGQSQDEMRPADAVHMSQEKEMPNQKKRKSQNDTPPSMIPASKIIKYGSEIEKANDAADIESESSMDTSIQKHFIGTFVLYM